MSTPVTPTPVIDRVIRGPFATGNHLRFARLDGTETVPVEQVVRDADRLARALARHGYGPGARIGIRARNGYEWVLLDLAALRLHAVTAGFEPGKFRDDDLLGRYQLSVLFDEHADGGDARVRPLGEVRDLLAEAEPDAIELPLASYAPDEPTTIKFSSGTTGAAKGLGAWAGSIDSSIAAVQAAFGHGPGDDLFLFLPLSLLQQRYWIYSALCFGHDVTVCTYEAALPLLRVRAQHGAGPTVVMGVPGFYETALSFIQASATGTDLGARRRAAQALFGERIRYLWTGSAPARPALVHAFHELGLPLYEGYGLNETCIVAKNHPGAYRPGSVGRLLPGKRVSFDEDGVISVHCDFPVNAAYDYASPGESERVFGPGGVVRTGDVGHLDADGFLFVHGRADDVIVLDNGKKVAVRPIEERLRAHPAVAEVVVFCPTASTLAAIVSPATQPAELASIEAHVAAANAELAHDEQLGRVIVAPEPFTVDNGLLTAQFKPRRRAIVAAFGELREAVPAR